MSIAKTSRRRTTSSSTSRRGVDARSVRPSSRRSLLEEYRRLAGKQPGVEITIDLDTQSITTAGGAAAIHFDFPPLAKSRLLKGLDDIQVVREVLPGIEAFERRHLAAAPWLAPARVTSP